MEDIEEIQKEWGLYEHFDMMGKATAIILIIIGSLFLLFKFGAFDRFLY